MGEQLRTILLIARPKVGKTLLLKNIVEMMRTKRLRYTGFYTEDIRHEDGSGCGFDIVTVDGKRAVLARLVPVNDLERPKVGKYYIYTDDFEALTMPILKVTTNSLLIIDEIDKMKLVSEQFKHRINVLLGKTAILATASNGRYRSNELVERIRADASTLVVEVTKFNRKKLKNCLVDKISRMIN